MVNRRPPRHGVLESERSPIGRHVFTTDLTSEAFLQDVARCRTFLTQQEALVMRQQGLGSRTTVSDLIVFGPRGPIDNRLHFANEPARHKVLDLVGDLALLGEDICGHVIGYCSGHPLNLELVREIDRRLDHTHTRQRAVA